MNVVLIGDAHVTGKNPICRIDDLTSTQFDKWEEIVEYANNKDCPIISTGDIFHTSIVANSTINSLGQILNKLKHSVYYIWGNHDLLYHSMDIWNRTSLGTLLTNHPNVRHISEFKRDYGISWDYEDWDCPLEFKGSSFLLTHRSIINKKLENVNFWIGKDKSFAKVVGHWSKRYSIIVCGHWHKQYHFKDNRTIVINPGPVSRLTTEDKLHPSICLLNLENGIFNRHPLTSAKPFDEVISDKHIKAKINNTENIKKFISAINKKSSKYDSAFMDNIMKLIEEHELDADLEKMLVDILSKTRERKNK